MVVVAIYMYGSTWSYGASPATEGVPGTWYLVPFLPLYDRETASMKLYEVPAPVAT